MVLWQHHQGEARIQPRALGSHVQVSCVAAQVYPSSGCATIRYDDGDVWTGPANPDIFLLPGQPGLQPAASALPVVEVPVIQEGQPCAPAVTAVPVGAPVDGGGIPVAQPVVVPAEAVVVRGY